MAKFEVKVLGFWLAEGQENRTDDVVRFAGIYRRSFPNDPSVEEYLLGKDKYLVCATGHDFYDLDPILPKVPHFKTDTKQTETTSFYLTWPFEQRKGANSVFETLLRTPKTSCWLVKRKLLKA